MVQRMQGRELGKNYVAELWRDDREVPYYSVTVRNRTSQLSADVYNGTDFGRAMGAYMNVDLIRAIGTLGLENDLLRGQDPRYPAGPFTRQRVMLR